jgi:hypothetical protein
MKAAMQIGNEIYSRTENGIKNNHESTTNTSSPADLSLKLQNVSTEDHRQDVQFNNTRQTFLDT